MPAKVIPIPYNILRIGGRILQKTDQVHRLCTSLQIDITKAKMLGWRPPTTLSQGLENTTYWYMNKK